jgi:hypothetical protein
MMPPFAVSLVGRVLRTVAMQTMQTELVSFLVLTHFRDDREWAFLPSPWPDRDDVTSPKTLVLVRGEKAGELWYGIEQGEGQTRRLAPATEAAGGGAEGLWRIEVNDTSPGWWPLARAKTSGFSIANLWVPVRGRNADGTASDYASEQRCLSLLRKIGFHHIRLLLVVPDEVQDESCRDVLNLLLPDRSPLAIYTFRLRDEGAGLTGEGGRDRARRIQFLAALYSLTRSGRLLDDSLQGLMDDGFLRSQPEVLGTLAYRILGPDRKMDEMRLGVQHLWAQVPEAAPWHPLSARVKARIRRHLPRQVWEFLRQARRSMFPGKEC